MTHRAAEGLIRAIQRIPPERRTIWAAWLLIFSGIGWVASHVILVLLDESTFFSHTMLAISWWAIVSTAWDIILTSDVRAEGHKG